MVEFAEIARLEPLGVGELFVEAGRLRWQGTTPRIEALTTPTFPRRTGVTLVLAGGLPAVAKPEPAELAKALGAEVRRWLGLLSDRNLEALGVHLDLGAAGQLPLYGTLLHQLRSELDRPLFLSATLERDWLGTEGVAELAGATDFVVAFLYGQRPEEPEQAAAWDLRKVEEGVRELESLGTDYLLGVSTLTTATVRTEAGRTLGTTTRFALAPVVRSSALELGHGFTLRAVDRSLYDFRARAATKVGELEVARGQMVRVMGLASYHVEEFQRRIGALDLRHLLGVAYYRLAAPDERASLSIARLERVLDPAPAAARPTVRLVALGGARYRVEVENLEEERTDVMMMGGNYVEIRTEGGSFGQVQPGDFLRWELLREEDGELVRAFRGAPILRLHTPILDGRETLSSGTIEIRGKAAVSASFAIPGGTVVEAEAGPH